MHDVVDLITPWRHSSRVSSCTYALVVLFFLSILRLAATRQSVAEVVAEVGADLQTWQLAVNLGACLFKALPFACSNFADIATEDHGASVPEASGQSDSRGGPRWTS